MKPPTGVTIIASLTFLGAAILAVGAFAFFFVAVMCMTGVEAGQPASVEIAGMGVAGGFALLVLAGIAVCLAIGVLKLHEWARIASVASIAVGIGCTIFSIFAFVGHPVILAFPTIYLRLIAMATGVWMLAYLVLPRVKLTFREVTA